MKKFTLIIAVCMLNAFSICSAQTVLRTKGILPDSSAKVGTWTEYQIVQDDKGTELYKYRVRLKSAKKFLSETSECIFEVEVVNLLKSYQSVDIVYGYDQVLSGEYSSQKGERRGFIAKGKKWNYELMVFHDKDKGQKQFEPCFKCDFRYTLLSSSMAN